MALVLVLIPSAGFGKHGIWLDPEDARSSHNRSLAWCEKKDYDKAISEFAEAIRLDPNSPAASTFWRRSTSTPTTYAC
jgi:tetratricopeptide (TPR) repeat protein